jgi:GTPase SAR1 family protein
MAPKIRILLIGLQAVGKSSIMKRLTESKFDPKIRPTLGTQIFNMVLDSTDFQVLDLGGQKKLRHDWYKPGLKPDGIIYVINCGGSGEHFKEAQEEYSRVLQYYYQNTDIPANKKPPLLVLGNKFDLLPEPNLYLLKDLIFDIPEDVPFEMKYCSAKTNSGVEDAFKWIVAEIIKRS